MPIFGYSPEKGRAYPLTCAGFVRRPPLRAHIDRFALIGKHIRPVQIFGYPSVADLSESECILDNMKRMCRLRPD